MELTTCSACKCYVHHGCCYFKKGDTPLAEQIKENIVRCKKCFDKPARKEQRGEQTNPETSQNARARNMTMATAGEIDESVWERLPLITEDDVGMDNAVADHVGSAPLRPASLPMSVEGMDEHKA